MDNGYSRDTGSIGHKTKTNKTKTTQNGGCIFMSLLNAPANIKVLSIHTLVDIASSGLAYLIFYA
jgi:hypothetical protein